jgi:hypothetical protein
MRVECVFQMGGRRGFLSECLEAFPAVEVAMLQLQALWLRILAGLLGKWRPFREAGRVDVQASGEGPCPSNTGLQIKQLFHVSLCFQRLYTCLKASGTLLEQKRNGPIHMRTGHSSDIFVVLCKTILNCLRACDQDRRSQTAHVSWRGREGYLAHVLQGATCVLCGTQEPAAW